MAKYATITRKKEEADDKTVNATEFIQRMISSRRVPDENIELPRTARQK